MSNAPMSFPMFRKQRVPITDVRITIIYRTFVLAIAPSQNPGYGIHDRTREENHARGRKSGIEKAMMPTQRQFVR